VWRLAMRLVSLGDTYKSEASGALGAWRHVSLARQSKSIFRLAAQEQR